MPSRSIVDHCNPMMTAGTATMNPAIGPAAPTSSNALRSMIGDFIRMKAPNVPMMNGIGGAGIKCGSVA